MSARLILSVLCAIPMTLLAQPPTASIIGRHDGRAVTFPGGIGTTVQGLALATFGTAQFELEASKERWDAAIKADHILVKFREPYSLAANIQEYKNGKVYAVSELLVPTTLATADAPMARVGDKYLAFGKSDPAPIVLLRERYLPARQ
jgi:hypothetical protein